MTVTVAVRSSVTPSTDASAMATSAGERAVIARCPIAVAIAAAAAGSRLRIITRSSRTRAARSAVAA